MITQEAARAIMGLNFFDSEESRCYLGVNNALHGVPYPETMLREKAITHVLVGIVGHSIAQLAVAFPSYFDDLHAEAFEWTSEEHLPRWLLLSRNQGVLGTNRPKLAMSVASDEQEVPLIAHDFIAAMLSFRLRSNNWARKDWLLNDGEFVATSDDVSGAGPHSETARGSQYNHGVAVGLHSEKIGIFVWGTPVPF